MLVEKEAMPTIPVFNQSGERIGEEEIAASDLGIKGINKQLLHDVVVMHEANRRVGTVNTRGRADVAGSGKKLFRQKGTGNARAGSKRTNKRKGGGVAFARRNRDYHYTMPKKAVRAALRMAILSKFEDGQALIVEGFGAPSAAGSTPKTKAVATVLNAIRRPDLTEVESTPVENESKTGARQRQLAGRSILIGLPGADPVFHRSARNIEGVMIAPVDQFNTYDVLKQRYLVLSREAFTALKDRAKQAVRRRPEPTTTAAAAAQES